MASGDATLAVKTRVGTRATWTRLAEKLDVTDDATGRDWRGLARRLGFSCTQIQVRLRLLLHPDSSEAQASPTHRFR